jgi:hypothetical protein
VVRKMRRNRRLPKTTSMGQNTGSIKASSLRSLPSLPHYESSFSPDSLSKVAWLRVGRPTPLTNVLASLGHVRFAHIWSSLLGYRLAAHFVRDAPPRSAYSACGSLRSPRRLAALRLTGSLRSPPSLQYSDG